MRKMILALVALLVLSASANAMSYEQARTQALFLTDKMAYELNLTEEQYEAAYEINLDYLMSVNSVDDLYGAYWSHRNLDLSYILFDWQYRAYVEASYFYRPLWWDGGYWHFGIYARYPHRNYYYFGRPSFYSVYRGAHSWRMNGGRSWYNGRRLFYGRNSSRQYGMRDGFMRGDFGRGNNVSYRHNGYYQNDRTRSFGNQQRSTFEGSRYMNRNYAPRESSTRTTVTRPNYRNSSNFGGNRSFGNSTRSYEPSRSFSAPSRSFSTPNRSFSGGASFGGSRSMGGNISRGGTFGGSSSGGTFGGHR
ncbi:MAG: hypothetical protein K6A82_02215 [Prevotella sp.]|nr:hypothetical protein [Prevotella sp.]